MRLEDATLRAEGWTVAEAAEAAGRAERTAYWWLARHDAGEAMADRSSAPRTCPTRTPVYGLLARKVPTDDDRVEAIRIALSGIARGGDVVDLRWQLEPLRPSDNTFPGEVLLGLAADAIELSGASRENPMEFEGIRERYLPECTAQTKVQHQHSKYALRAAAMIRAGVDPGLLDEVIWWQSDDLWVWALDALAAYVRAAADRMGVPVDVV